MKIFRRRNKYNCKAASNSMLFQPSGEVLPCHYNRGYVLGKYPEQTIQEIWQSVNRKNLLKSIHNAKFDLGCYQCKNDIDAGLEYSAGLNKYSYIEVGHKNSLYPSLMEFQLDNICNLECIMCSGEYSHLIRKNREKGEAYISPYDEKFVEQLKEFIPYLKQVGFTGGEPFLIPIYYKIWDVVINLNPDLPIYVSSNGSVLNEKIKYYLEKLNFNFTISIDSLDAQTYQNIRKTQSLTM